jgi:CheY-like chemotaxis protein
MHEDKTYPCIASGGSEADRPRAAVRPGRRGRVLVVDDDLHVCTVIGRILGQEHEVVAVLSATQALELIRAGERFDVVLCDLMMPEMTGMDLHAELTRMVSDQAERMVFMTGGLFDEKVSDFLDSIGKTPVLKPFCRTELRQLIQDRLR